MRPHGGYGDCMSARLDFGSLERPSSPNTYLLAPEGLCQKAAPDAPSPLFDMPAEALFARIEDFTARQTGWTVAERLQDALQLDIVARTKVLKFKDDVSVRAIAAAGNPQKSQLAVYSRSRVGYHDLGANRKRVERMIAELKEAG